MPWKTMEIQDQRVRFVIAACQGNRPFRALCAEYGISRPTGYLWLSRYRQGGVAAIAERSRRPHVSPARTSRDVEEQLIGLRRLYPDWGARKLAVLLERQGIELPVSTIHRVLLRHGLVRDCDRHSPALQRFARQRPNELWQMDFKGPKNWPRSLTPLSVIDDHSRYVIALEATGRPDGALVKQRLERAFEQCGVPEAMLMDHGTPWWNWQSFCGRTHLALWLMRQGIRLHWSGIAHPQTQGKVERFHGSLQRAWDCRGLPQGGFQIWLDNFRAEHNTVRPHEALEMRTPAEFWQPSPRRYNPCPPAWEYPLGSWTLKVDCQGTIDIGPQRWRIGKTLAGERVLIEPVEGRYLVYYCATLVRELDLAMKRSTIVERFIETPKPPLNV